MKLNQSQQQVQKQVLSAVMQQSIEMLLLPIGELDQAISQALQENPMLEVQEDTTPKTNEQLDIIEKFIEQKLHRNNDSGYLPTYESSHEEDTDDRPLSRGISLEEHLMQQLHLEISDPLHRKIGEQIIGNLDGDGYFSEEGCADIANKLNLKNPKVILEVLNKIQHFDPVGIAARNLQECLLLQIPERFNGKSETTAEIIRNHFDDLCHKRFLDISRKMNISMDDVKAIAKNIASLEPKPSRKFSQITGEIYIKPDVMVRENDGRYLVEVNNEHIPRLTVAKTYRHLLENPRLSEQEKEFIRERIKNAVLFIKSIDQRGQTLKRIADFIVERQHEFWEKGHTALKPMILKDIAEALERNESTISRAIHNKYMDTPQGLLPMKYFFSQAVTDDDNHTISNRSIKETIREIIDHEDRAKPLSDQKILELLKTRNIVIARRTISKYREELHILPAHLRKE